MTLTFTKATKKALKARVAIEGPSGSGKTYTALLTARALAGPGGKVAVVDTERRSASLYADRFDFDALELDSFAPTMLIDALEAAAGYDVVVIDSLSHFWMGVDGMLEQVDRAGKRGGGNNFAGWKEMRPVERRMVDAMLAFPGHVLATLRVKTDYVVETNDRGRAVPKKVGLRAEQREGLEYEFTLVASMDLENTLVVTKSRCPELAGQVIARPDESFGLTMLAWLNSGETATETATQIRDEILAAGPLTVDEYRARHAKARAAGLLSVAIQDEHGDTTTLGEWIVARGKAVGGGSSADRGQPPPVQEVQ